MTTEKDIIEDLNYKIEELREYLNVPLESSQDISDLSLRQIIDLEIDHKGYLIDYIEFEKLRAELKGIQSQKQKIIEEIEKRIKDLDILINNLTLIKKSKTMDMMKHHLTCEIKVWGDRKQELLNSLGEKDER